MAREVEILPAPENCPNVKKKLNDGDSRRSDSYCGDACGECCIHLAAIAAYISCGYCEDCCKCDECKCPEGEGSGGVVAIIIAVIVVALVIIGIAT